LEVMMQETICTDRRNFLDESNHTEKDGLIDSKHKIREGATRMTVEYTRDYARTLDAQDPLHAFRDEFYLNENAIYMDGNSLGLLSKRAEQTTYQLLESWKEFGIDGWTEG